MHKPAFAAFTLCIDELLSRLNIKERFIYLHDFGAPIGLHLAMRALIIGGQNGVDDKGQVVSNDLAGQTAKAADRSS